ncbi:MAG: gamma-glutamyltransferase [Chloroflexi bacterium]|nr:gamma-glutamyltransferase [Chloroflexota bacterium]
MDRSLKAVLLGTFTLRFSTGLTGAMLNFYLASLVLQGNTDIDGKVVGLLAATFYIAELGLSPLFGILSDRIGHHRVLLYGPAFGVVAVILTALTSNVVVLGGTRLLEGASTAASVPSILGFIALATAGNEALRGKAAARFEGATLAGLGAGFIVAPTLFALMGPNAFLLNAAFYGGSLLIYRFGVEDPAGEREALAAPHTGLRRYVDLVRHSHVLLLAPTWIAINASIGLWFSQALFQLAKRNPLFPDQWLLQGFSANQITGGAIAVAIIAGAGIIWWGDRFDQFRRTTIILFGIIGGLGLVAAGLVVNHGAFQAGESLAHTALIGGASLLVAAGLFLLAGATPAAVGLLADVSEKFPGDRGAIMGLYSVFLGLGQIVGSLIGGVVADARHGTSPGTRSALDPRTQSRVSDAGAGPHVPVPLARGRHGAVVAPHHLATEAGLSVLRAGGHAVDAAIATTAVLATVVPKSCGIGGDAFWLIWDAGARRQFALNGSGRAPAGADAAALRARGLTTLPLRGPLSVTVPGAVRSWGDAHRRFGRLARDAVLAPAIELARGGFPAWDGFIDAVERSVPIVEDALGRGSAFAAHFRPFGRPWRPGEMVRFPALAATFERLAVEGFDAFYDGDLGEAQARFLAAAGGPHQAGDFGSHASNWADPIETTYRGVRVTSHPPNSSGIVALELLNILEAAGPPPDGAFGPDGSVADPGWIHRAIEAAKLAMADRDAYLTDPEFSEIPVARLLDKGYAGELAAQIPQDRASAPLPSSNPRGGGTVYLGVVDGEGNAVSLIESNYLGFGSGLIDPATGIHYQNRGSYFSLEPGHPNVLAPGKRTLHTLLPGMLFREPDRPWVVAGAMGGDAQPQVHAQLVSALVDGGLDIRAGVAAPRWFVEPKAHFAPPTVVRAEPRFAPGILEALAAMGHDVQRMAPFDSWLGLQHAIELVDGGPSRPGGSVAAATDPRSAGLPAVW